VRSVRPVPCHGRCWDHPGASSSRAGGRGCPHECRVVRCLCQCSCRASHCGGALAMRVAGILGCGFPHPPCRVYPMRT
jgi:hypothetical protein